MDLDLTAVLRPVRAGNAFEETVERLLTVIKLGFIATGERFPAERDLATQLGVSRITLREAIRALQQAGYVESRRGRFGGTFVTARPPRQDPGELRRLAADESGEFADALTFRMAVDVGAAQVLARQVRDRDARTRDQITGVLRARLADLDAAEPGDYRRLDTMFHMAIADLTGSALLAAASADARLRLNNLLDAIPVLWKNIEHTAPQHAAIVAAILAGDPYAAARAVTEHLEGTEALLRGFLA
jgi:DNA-binding FadR family transcriptional regulator